MTESAWQRVSPLAIAFFLGQSVSQLAKGVWQMVVPAAAVILTTDFISVHRIIIASGFVMAGLIVFAVAAYWRMRFRVDAQQLVLRTGVFKRRQLNLEYARVQSVSIEQNLVYRLSGVVDIRLDSPGSAADEARLPAIRPEIADNIRERVRAQRANPMPVTTATRTPGDDSAGFETLTTLHGFDFVRIGVASNRALVLLALAGSAWGTLTTQDVKIDWQFYKPLEAWLVALDWTQWLLLMPAAAIALTLFFMLLSTVGAWLRFSDFELLAGAQTLQTRAGLLTRHEQSVSLQKVQELRMSRGLLHRCLNIASVRIHQIGSGHGATHLDVPLTRPALFADLVRRCLSPSALQDGRYRPAYRPISKHYLTAKFRSIAALPAVAGTTVLVARDGPLISYALPVIWLTAAMAFHYLRYRRHAFVFNAAVIASRRGLAQTTTTVMAPNRIQAIQYKQSPFQRRRGLVTLKLVSASGTTTHPFLDISDADRGAELCLNAAANERLNWH